MYINKDIEAGRTTIKIKPNKEKDEDNKKIMT